MSARRRDEGHPTPVVRYAPLGELNVYPVYEHELESLARGSTGSLFLNFALFLLPISITLWVTLATTKIESDRLFQGFLSVSVITAIFGVVLLVFWLREHRSATALVVQIKNRMPPPPAIQREGGDQGTAAELSPGRQREESAPPPPPPPGEPLR